MPEDASMNELMTKLQGYLDAHAERPWCVHEMFESVGAHHPGEDMLVETQRALIENWASYPLPAGETPKVLNTMALAPEVFGPAGG